MTKKKTTPTKITDDLFARIVNRVADGATISEACEEQGIYRSSLQTYRRNNPAADRALKAARAETFDNVRAAMYKKAINGDVQAAKVWMDLVEKDEALDLTGDQDAELEEERRRSLEDSVPGMDEVDD